MVALRNLARVALLWAAVLGAGCASSQDRGEGAASRGSIDAGELQFDALEPQPMESGDCGIFLWAQTARQPILVLAAFSEPAAARVRVQGRTRELPRTVAEGQASHGHFERQTYSDGRLTLTVDVGFDAGRPLRDGAAIERGVIRVTDRRGWETIIPVGGLVACEP
jgi:hypothetical protein